MRARPFVSLSVLSVFFFMMSVGGLMAVNAQTIGPNDVKIVDISYDGQTRTLPTRASTVDDLITRLGIEVSELDLIEPVAETAIDSDNFQINIYRAEPVSITDNGETRRVLSAYNDPRLIAEQAGYILGDEDLAVFDVDTAADLSTLDIGNRIMVTRAKEYTINLYGNRYTKRSHTSDVDALLADASIVLAEGDVVTPSLDTTIKAGQEITIARFGTIIETLNEVIPYETKTTNDNTLNSGTINVTKPGSDGSKTVTYEIDLENDVEVSRRVISEVVTQEPIAKEQIRGTKPRPISTNVSGDKEFLMSAAGIPRADWGYADAIIAQESSWNPNAVNSIGACGLPQALPCSKLGPNWNDPVTALKWAHQYALSYGGWAQAYTFKFCVGNCYSPRTNLTTYKPASNKWW